MIKRHLFSLMVGCLFFIAGVDSSCSAMAIKDDSVIVDMAGRHIPVSAPFKKVVSLYPAHTENLIAIGASNNLVGLSVSDTVSHHQKRLNKLVRFSYHDDPEKFIAEMPDLILIRPMIDKGYAKLVKRLEQSGIIVVSLQPKTVEAMFVYWQILGTLTGKVSESKKMITDFKDEVKKIEMRTAHLSDLQKKKVYFQAMHRQMRTFTENSMAMYALKKAGGLNMASDARSSKGTNIAIYGKEKLLSKGPEIDVFLVQKGRMNNISKKTILNEPGFSLIKAIRENQIFFVDEKLVSRPTFGLIKGMKMIGGCLYPELFGDITQKEAL